MNKNLTVYICTYHEEDNIQDCIKSINKNDLNNIVVIDASNNKFTKKEAEQCGVNVISTEKGLAGQRQVAINDCKTEFLMFVDADDRLEESCIVTLLNEMKLSTFDAIQANVKVFKPISYWEKGMDANLRCINVLGRSNMIGRPAIYKSSVLKQVGMDVSFNGVGNEDAALSIKMEKFGALQGKGSGVSYRHHPSSFKENFEALKKYGLGDAQLIKTYPDKLFNILKHLLYVYPIKRSFLYLKNGEIKYIGYPILTGLVRFLYMVKGLIIGR